MGLSGTTKSYGSVPTDEEEAVAKKVAQPADESFDADAAYYLKHEEAQRTRRDKIRKICWVGMPVVIAALLVGTAALWLTKNFGLLYPSSGVAHAHTGASSRAKNAVHRTSSTPAAEHTVDDDDVKTKQNPRSAAACSAYAGCVHLEGQCCPTTSGTMLNCCSANT